jgi:hypothetical protein
MRRLTLVIALVTSLSARSVAASPPPTPTPTPHNGPTLDVTFSGVVLFVKTTPGPGYRAIVPARHGKMHLPYIVFLKEGASTSNWDSSEFECEEEKLYKWVSLTADKLTIEPASAIAPGSFKSDAIEGWLPHLGKLTENNHLNDEDYNQSEPVVGKVAAQIDITRGTLAPLILTGQYEPVQWEFRSEDGNQKSGITICGPAGIRWLLPIKKGTRSISIVSSLRKRPKVTVPLADEKTTVVVIGNSRPDDIECPKKGIQPKDPDFALHYMMLTTPPKIPWIPWRVDPRVPCVTPPADPKGNKSLRGSDCIGGQWP